LESIGISYRGNVRRCKDVIVPYSIMLDSESSTGEFVVFCETSREEEFNDGTTGILGVHP
jgi:hypothetical protein